MSTSETDLQHRPGHGAPAPVARPLRGRVISEPALGDRGLPGTVRTAGVLCECVRAHESRSRRHRKAFAAALASLPRKAGLVLIRGYQLLLSPLLAALGGPGSGCRFHPTCSHYAAGAVSRHGLLAGSWLAAKRLAKCHPWHAGGADPVPEFSPFSLKQIRPDRPPFRGAAHPNG